MKKRNAVYAHEQAKIYRAYYKPSFNLFRFFKAILSVLIFGSPTVAQSYAPIQKPRRRAK